MDKLRLMQSFVQVVRAGSFTAAADALRVSPPVITKHVAELEAILGLRLINRTTRSLRPTEVGLNYFEFCNQILKELDDKEAALHSLQIEPRGSLKIGAPSGFASLYGGQLIAEFVQTYPQIEPSIYLNPRPDRVNLLGEGYDLVLALRVPEEGVAMEVQRICRFRRVICAAPSYLANHGKPRSPRDLARFNCMLNVRIGTGTTWHLSSAKGRTNVAVRGAIKSNSVIALRSAAISGGGIALLPTYCVDEDIRAGRLIHLLPGYAVRDGELVALYPEKHPPKKVRVFVEFLTTYFRNASWFES